MPKAYYKRGLVKEKLGDKTGTIEDYNQAIELNPQDAEAYNNRGKCKKSFKRI